MSDTDITSKIITFEEGEMNDEQVLDLFSELVKTGMVWELQGSYGRFAKQLIENDFLTEGGEITQHAKDALAAAASQ